MPVKINKNSKSSRVEILRVGTFDRRFDDDLKITLDDLKEMKRNFDADCRRQKMDGRPVLPFNFSHEIWAEAAGWIVGLEIDKNPNDFDALFAEVEWTPKGRQKIKDKEFKFVSSEFIYNYKDSETGQRYDIALGGAALTNIPFIRDMEAVNLSESHGGQRARVSLELSGDPDFNFQLGEDMPELIKKFKSMSPEDQEKFLAECGLMPKDKKLSEELEQVKSDLNAKEEALKLAETERDELRKNADSGEKNEALKLAEGKIGDLEKEVLRLTQEREADKKEAEFNAMLSEGKVCPAQKDAYMKGDMAEFIKNAQEVKLDEVGSNAKGDEGGDAQDKVLRLADEKMEKDSDLTFGEAVSLVLSENPELNKKYEEA